jgi:hypothetical protein
MFIGMWNFCDDYGNHPASLKTLKMQLFPADDIPLVEIETYITELHEQELIFTYGANGKEYWHVTGWHHQKIERPSRKFPDHEGENSLIIRQSFTD